MIDKLSDRVGDHIADSPPSHVASKQYRRTRGTVERRLSHFVLLAPLVYGRSPMRCLPSNGRIVRRAGSTSSRQRALTETGGGYWVEVRITAMPQVGQKCCPPVAVRQK
jgi:hypothetical protein